MIGASPVFFLIYYHHLISILNIFEYNVHYIL